MVGLTLFDDVHARTCSAVSKEWGELVAYLGAPREYPNKAAQPLLSLAQFGAVTTKNGSLRHDANVISVWGVMLDHDAGTMSPEKARDLFASVGMLAIIYATASHRPEAPRWRALLPCSQPYAPAAYRELVGRANAIVGGAAAPESFKLSQSYYFGRVSGVEYVCYDTQGSCVDLLAIPPLFPSSGATSKTVVSEADWTTEAEEGWDRVVDDAALRVNLADPSKGNAREKFGETWATHWLWGSDAAPDQLAVEGKRSEGRLALLTRMMHRNGGNCEQVLRLATDPEHPLLVKEGRIDLLREEILKARALFSKWWEPVRAEKATRREEAKKIGEGLPEGIDCKPLLLTCEEMLPRLVYVTSGPYVADLVTGRVLTEAQAIGAFAPSKTEIVNKGEKEFVSSLKLWRSHQGRRTVDQITWDPEGSELCGVIEASAEAGVGGYNTWRGLHPLPPVPDNWQAWAKVFTDHVEYLVPIEAERVRFLQWLGHMFQRPWELPHTAYLMVTRMTGIGRNTLGEILARAMPGNVALGFELGTVLGADGAEAFTGRLSRKLLAVVDEAAEGKAGMSREDRSSRLNSFITKEVREINPKYGHRKVERNCLRLLCFTNVPDALPIGEMDRRVIVIANPTEPRPEEYYAALRANVARPELASSVRKYLMELDLTGFNPGARAPMNEAKVALHNALRSPVEEAVAQFKAQWPSQVAGSRDLRDYVQRMTEEEKLPGAAAMGHIYRRAGIVVRKVMVRIAGVNERVIGWGIDFENSEPLKISEAIREAREKFKNL